METHSRALFSSPAPVRLSQAHLLESFGFSVKNAHRRAASKGLPFPNCRLAGKLCLPASAYPTSSSSAYTPEEQNTPLGETGGGGFDSWDGSSGGGGGRGWDHEHSPESEDSSGSSHRGGIFGVLLQGWDERVKADPQFPFKVLMEQVVGVGAAVIGDMASRPNFGLTELDFVFSTLVVGSILNFSLMYILAPTSASSAAAAALPWIFSSCPSGHMFEQGAYTAVDRLGTFVYKGAVFAAVGFGAGLFGTFLSNCLIELRKRMDPSFEPQNKAPPTLLNAVTWSIHMGISSNLRYQLINGMEFSLANVLPPPAFKVSVFSIRAFNNVLGGFSFVQLARLTGSQKKGKTTDFHTLVESERRIDDQGLEKQANTVEFSPHDTDVTAIAPQRSGKDASKLETLSSEPDISTQKNEIPSSVALISEMYISKPGASATGRDHARS